MSKTYIVSRNGGTVTKAPINDNKIPIYANETALDADLSNLADNTLVLLQNSGVYEVYTENGTKKKKQITGNGYGLPLGTWISYEGTCPDGFLEAGTTFNTTTYAALYAMLGTNVVPEMFDHSRLGDYELSTFTTTNTQVQFDGELTFRYNGALVWVYVNDVQIACAGDIYGSSATIQSSATISFKKGDNIRFSMSITGQYVRYYKRHLAIKATPAYVEPDTVSDMVNTLRTQDSYSTSEVNTGKKWIDGKPIYRKVFQHNNISAIDLSDLNVNALIDASGFATISGYVYPVNTVFFTNSGNIWFATRYNASTNVMDFSVGGSFTDATIVLEYTKTTD